MKTFSSRLLILLACLLSTACLEIEEEVWLHDDGSARLKQSVQLDLAPLDAMEKSLGGSSKKKPTKPTFLSKKEIRALEKELKRDPDVKDVTITLLDQKSRIGFSLDVATKTWEALPRLQKIIERGNKGDKPASLGAGPLLAAKGKDIVLEQVFPATGGGAKKKMGKKDAGSELAEMMMAGFMKNAHIGLTLHAPRIVSHNGQKVDAQTVRWVLPLTEELERSKKLTWKAAVRLK